MYAEKSEPPPSYPGFQQQPNMFRAPSPAMYGNPSPLIPQMPIIYHQQRNAGQIKDYLVWSILNLLFGWFLGGILPLIFSLICRSNKNVNDYNGAKTMSTLALIFNILVTVCGLLGWIGLIVGIALTAAATSASGIYP